MEYAFYISDIKNLKYWSNKYSRLYFGAEFCENLLPSCRDVNYALRFAKKRNLGFTFVTPYATDNGLERIRRLLGVIKRNALSSVEVVFNDMGVLSILKEEYPDFIRAQGRLKTYTLKGSIFGILENNLLNRLALHFLNKSRMKKHCVIKLQEGDMRFFKSQNIRRIEANAPLICECACFPPSEIPISLYTPYGFITTTRYCPVALADKHSRALRVVRGCSLPCLKSGVLILRSKRMIKHLLLRGNTYFYETSIEESKAKNISRLVYQPVLPY